MSQDTLSDVLRTVRLRGAVFFYVSGGREWAAESPAAKDIASAVMPGAEHVMEYHVVIAGDCWAGIVGQSPVRLSAGDIVLFPHGDAHVISSAPGMRAEPNVAWYYEAKIDQLPIRVAYDGTRRADTCRAGSERVNDDRVRLHQLRREAVQSADRRTATHASLARQRRRRLGRALPAAGGL